VEEEYALTTETEPSLENATATDPSIPKRLTTWDILNSQLVLWILGSVILSGITTYWNWRNDNRAAESNRMREDSQFLSTMLPYLTNADVNVRLRAVDVINSRYPARDMPDQIKQLTAKVLESAAGQPKQTEETQSLVATVAHTLDRQAEATGEVAPVQQLPPRVYLQIFQEQQRETAKKIQGLLRGEGLLAPGIENVGAKSSPVTGTIVRYFNDADEAVAQRVRQILHDNGLPQASVQRFQLKANPGSIEVWFGLSP